MVIGTSRYLFSASTSSTSRRLQIIRQNEWASVRLCPLDNVDALSISIEFNKHPSAKQQIEHQSINIHVLNLHFFVSANNNRG